MIDSWTFEDASVMHNCPTPKAQAYVENGWAVIHGHSCTANGILKQEFATVTNPKCFYIDYELLGSCSAFNVRLNYGSEEVILFRGNIDTTPGYPSITSINLLWRDYIEGGYLCLIREVRDIFRLCKRQCQGIPQ